MIKVTENQASAIYRILIDVCGASDSTYARILFVDTFSYDPEKTYQTEEFRFQGKLGYGGKIYNDSYHGIRVSTYKENSTKEIQKMIQSANVLLKEFK
jgi:hypothetical protein